MKKSKWIIASALLSLSVASFGMVACGSGSEPDVVAPVITVDGASEYLINYGSTFTLPKITIQDDKDENVTWNLSVKNGDTTATVDENGSFVAEKAGTYTVSVDATDSSGNTANKQFKIEVRGETEINNFDTEARLKGVTHKGIAEVSINTNPEYIRYGTGSLKLEVKEHIATSWPGIIVSELPINDIIDYYSISFWIYNDGTDDINIYLQRNELNGKAKHTIPAKTWTKIEVLARDYDNVFQYMKKSGAEPEVGTCEDLKCFTFHLANPANVPTFNIYVDEIQVNKEKIYDTLDITAEVSHPVVGVEYSMPSVSVKYGGEEVTANVSYVVYDKDYNKLDFADNKITFTDAGEYTLIVNAEYNGLTSSVNYMLVCSSSRADNEIAFFEDVSNLSFFTSEHFAISHNTEQKHTDNNSTASMKLHSCESRWPYLTISGIPYADLEGVAYIYMYAKTDYELKDSETAYLGIRDGNRGKVLKRISLSNDWKCFALTKEQLAEVGVTTLEGLQLSVELYDTTNPKNEGGWCPVAFNTYIDNFTVGKVAEPIEKEEGVVLDFANYRDLDDLTSNGYISYNFSNLEMTLNNKGSLKVSASAKWPEFHFGDRFDAFSIEGAKNLVFDVFVPTFDAGFLRLGVNDSQYQKVTPASSGQWVSLYVPIKAITGETLKGIEVNVARNNGSDWANVGTFYIGKVWLDYEGKPEEVIDPEFSNGEVTDDLYMFTVKNDEYLMSLNTDATFVKDGEKSIKLSAIPRWPAYYFSQYFIDFLNENNYVKFSFDLYVDDAGSETNIDFYEGCIASYSDIQDEWFTVTLTVANVTTSTFMQFNKLSAKTMNMYLDNIQYFTAEDIIPEVQEFGSIETEYDLNMFTSSGTLSLNEKATFVKEGSKSIKMAATPRWPKLYFTQEFIDHLVAENVESISIDLYIDNAGSATVCNRMEGYKLIYVNDLTVDAWFTLTLKVSELSTSKFFQFNKDAAESLSIYVDNLQYIKANA